MTHWGWHWRVKNKQHIARTLCSKLPTIDSFKLYKEDTKNFMRSGFTVAPLDVKAEASPDYLKITYRKRKEHSYTIAVEKLPCNYGGFRYFFKCPLCQVRMRFLYLAQKSIFLCRKCLNLGYEIQRLRPTRRYSYMSDKVKNLVKSKGGNLSLYKKPPRMHIGTYERLKGKKFDYEERSYEALRNELLEWHGSGIENYL